MYQKTVLPNKLRIISHHMKERESVSVGLLIATGGRYENKKNKGAAHFLEHILFKGSKNYSCEEIKELIEGVGGALNAFTAEETTCYFAKTPGKHLPRTFDILGDMVFDPLINKKDVDKERTVILEEIKMYHDVPQYFVLELLDELMWPDHPLGQNLAGSFETVGGMSAKDLKSFHQNYYFPGNIVVCACGHLEHSRFVNLVRKKLACFDVFKKTNFLAAQNNQSEAQVKFFRKEIEQMHLALGMPGLPVEHKDRYALSLLNVILGANMSSRLFTEVREKRGLAYSISSSTKSLQDTGLFLIRAGVDNNKIVAALEVVLKELKKICLKEVHQDEFIRAKDYFLGQFLLGLEDTLDHMLWMGESLMTWDKVRSLEEIIKEVNQVKISDIKRVANEIFQAGHLNLALVGPLKDGQEKGIRSLFNVRRVNSRQLPAEKIPPTEKHIENKPRKTGFPRGQ